MKTVEIINFTIMCLFFLCYSYQFFYIPVSLLGKQRPLGTPRQHRYGVLIAARNESAVIGQLLDSIRGQDYPAELVDIFVVADNCTDDTAAVAAAHGARVFCRRDTSRIGKGYALAFLLKAMERQGFTAYDAYLVLDADNLIAPDYISEMNKTFSAGYRIVTSYRNSKNYGDNWISAGYALWFLRESRYLNQARMLLGSSCAVSGTGFLFSRETLERCGGWHFFLLTEDIEFTIFNVLRGERIGYCGSAVVYDEQPTDFRQSWRQRLRWSRGYMQVFARYGGALLKGMFRGSLSCYDMAMNIMPAAILTCASLVLNVGMAFFQFATGGDLAALALSLGQTVCNLYLTLFVLGAITTATEWKKIHCSGGKKLLYMFTFPLFMFTYLPICIASLFIDVQWQPIRHQRSMRLEEIGSGVCGQVPSLPRCPHNAPCSLMVTSLSDRDRAVGS